MQTRCPACQTTFRVTPEQLKARAGKVRCGQCQAVFNALDSLVDAPFEAPSATSTPSAFQASLPPRSPAPPTPPTPHSELHFLPIIEDEVAPREPSIPLATVPHLEPEETPPPFSALDSPEQGETTPFRREPALRDQTPETAGSIESTADTPADIALPAQAAPEEAANAPGHAEPRVEIHALHADPFAPQEPPAAEPLSPSAAHALGKATGLIMPRETTEIPGYSKWSEGVMTTPLTLPPEKPTRTPFILAAILLILALGCQLAYYYRSELVVMLPALRPLATDISHALGTDLPLPRHIAQISIETSDLQTDAARGNLLLLNATLRNRAAYGQAFPALELSLTDTQDNAIVRKVFLPADYLPGGMPADAQFPATTDIAVRLWLEPSDVEAAGYRLYVFFP